MHVQEELLHYLQCQHVSSSSGLAGGGSSVSMSAVAVAWQGGGSSVSMSAVAVAWQGGGSSVSMSAVAVAWKERVQCQHVSSSSGLAGGGSSVSMSAVAVAWQGGGRKGGEEGGGVSQNV